MCRERARYTHVYIYIYIYVYTLIMIVIIVIIVVIIISSRSIIAYHHEGLLVLLWERAGGDLEPRRVPIILHHVISYYIYYI